VRLHTGAAAAALSRSIDAQAFTCGSHIYFDQGRYAPHCASGLELLAHETAHVTQQGAAEMVRRRINIPEGDDLPIVMIDEIVEKKSARTLEWHSQADRESAAELFAQRNGTPLLTWLQANVTDKAELVRSFAYVIDGLDSLPHVDLALAAIAGTLRVPPPAVLEESKLAGRAAIRKRYETTFKALSPHRSLLKDLLFYYGHHLVEGYQKCAALLDHDLTDAERLHFMGVGRNRGGDVEAPSVIKLIRDRWAEGGFTAIERMDRDWAHYVHMDTHWGWNYPAWSSRYLFGAVHYSISDDSYLREIHPILATYEKMKEARKIAAAREKNPDEELLAAYGAIDLKAQAAEGVAQDLEDELFSAYWVIEEAAKAGNEEQARQGILLYHRIWRRFLGRDDVKAEPQLRKKLEERYRGRVSELPIAKLKQLRPLLQTMLTPQGRLAELHLASPAEFEAFVTSAWLTDPDMFRVLCDGRIIIAPAARGSLPHKRIAALLAPALSDAERGYRRLSLELHPEVGTVSDIRGFRPDNDLEPVYRFLTTPGMSKRRREDIVQAFAERASGGGRSGEPAGVFLRFLYKRFEGFEGRWFIQIWDLLDPATSNKGRVERAKLKKEAGRNPLVAQAREAWDIARGEEQDLEGGVDAGIKNIAAAGKKDFGFVLADEHGVPVGDKLEELLVSISDKRIKELHAREDEVAIAIAGAIEVGVEGLVGFFAGPAGWAQVIAALAGNLAGQVAREGLLGTANTAISGENLKALVMAGLGSYLFDVKDFRGWVAERVNVSTLPLLQKLKTYDKSGLELAWRAQSAMQNAVAGLHDQLIPLIVGTLLDPILLATFPDEDRMAKDAAQAFARVLARTLHGPAYTFDVNPGSVTDSMKLLPRVKEMVGFKLGVKASEKLGAELTAAAIADPYFTLNDAFHVTAVTLAKGVMGMSFKTTASAIANHQLAQARLPLSQRWQSKTPANQREAIAGEVVEKDWALTQSFRAQYPAAFHAEKEGQPWSAGTRQLAGRWLEEQGKLVDSSGRFIHPQVGKDLEARYAKAAKAEFGSVDQSYSGRTTALGLRRGEQSDAAGRLGQIRKRLQEDPRKARLLLTGVLDDPALRLDYVKDVTDPHKGGAGKGLRAADWVLQRMSNGDEHAIDIGYAQLRNW
jgi:hypothetical protein